MDGSAELCFDIPEWGSIRDVRDAVSSALAEQPEEVRQAAMMTASELAENAIKYSGGAGASPSFRCRVQRDEICLEVTNPAAPDIAEALRRRVSQIAETPNKQDLYHERLMKMMEDPTCAGGLGLYRIAFEGKFNLNCSHIPGAVRLTATRVLR